MYVTRVIDEDSTCVLGYKLLAVYRSIYHMRSHMTTSWTFVMRFDGFKYKDEIVCTNMSATGDLTKHFDRARSVHTPALHQSTKSLINNKVSGCWTRYYNYHFYNFLHKSLCS